MTKSPWRQKSLTVLLASLLFATGAAMAQAGGGKATGFYEDALKRYERRDYAGAIIQLKNALRIDKTQLSVHLLLGKAMLANGEVANAEFELSEALRLGVNRAEVAVPLAQTLAAQGKQALILEDARLQLPGLPTDVQQQLLLLRASAASDIGDTRAAMKAIEEARALKPSDVGSWLAEVPLRIRARQFAEAMTAANRALKLAPEMSEAQHQKASIQHVQGQIAVALSGYERALKLDSKHVESRLARAGILLDLDRDKEAQADVNELLQQAPSDPRARYLRALLAERAGDAAAAKAALQQVTALLDAVPIEFIRYRPQMLMLNGLAHYGLNEPEKAKPYLEYALRQQPNSPLAKLLAQVLLAEPNVGRAIELLEAYVKASPGDGQALLMLASAQMSQGRHAKATALMQQALRTKDAPEFRTALGLSLMRGGKSGNATEELEKAYKADPKQSYAGIALVNLYLRSAQLNKALLVAEGLVKNNPNNPSALIVQAMAKVQAGDLAGARAGYEQALKLDPKLLEPKLGLARVEVAGKSFEAANKRLREVLREDGRNVDVLFEMAVLHEVWGRNDEALKWLESAVDASGPGQTRANFALVAWQLRKGQTGKALDAAKLLLAKAPDDVEALQAYAGAQFAVGDMAGARSSLTNASRRAGLEAPVQVEIARAQLRVKDLAGAAYSLDKALSGTPDHLPAMALMSSVERLQGETDKAERRARQIQQAHPKSAIGYQLLADVALGRGQTAAGLDALRRAHEIERSSSTLLRLFQTLAPQDGGKQAIELAEGWLRANPKDLTVRKALADAQARAGNFAAARRNYEAALSLRATDAETLNNLANVLLQQKDPSAVAIAEKALAQRPGDPQIIDTAGWANHLAGNRDRALQLLRDARLRAPANPDIRYHLAVVLAQAGRKAEARDELQAALQNKAGFENSSGAKSLLDTLN